MGSSRPALTHCAPGRGGKRTGARPGREEMPFKKKKRKGDNRLMGLQQQKRKRNTAAPLSRSFYLVARRERGITSLMSSSSSSPRPRKERKGREPLQDRRATQSCSEKKSETMEDLFGFFLLLPPSSLTKRRSSSPPSSSQQELGELFFSFLLVSIFSPTAPRWSASTTGRSSRPGRGASSPRRSRRTPHRN